MMGCLRFARRCGRGKRWRALFEVPFRLSLGRNKLRSQAPRGPYGSTFAGAETHHPHFHSCPISYTNVTVASTLISPEKIGGSPPPPSVALIQREIPGAGCTPRLFSVPLNNRTRLTLKPSLSAPRL